MHHRSAARPGLFVLPRATHEYGHVDLGVEQLRRQLVGEVHRLPERMRIERVDEQRVLVPQQLVLRALRADRANIEAADRRYDAIEDSRAGR